MVSRIKEYIKFGFGFYVGYELAKSLNDEGKAYIERLIERIKKGY